GILLGFIFTLTGCANSPKNLPPEIAKYYPPHGGGIMGLGSDVYINRLFVDGPNNQFHDGTAKDFYLAYNGDEAAFLRFLSSKDQDVAGEPAEGWISDAVVLALRYKDDALRGMLLKANPKMQNYFRYVMLTMLKPEDIAR